MAKNNRDETLDPATLGDEERSILVNRLFPVQQGIFDGVDEAGFVKKVFPPRARWTRIRIFRDPAGEPVGYCALHLFEKRLQRRSYAVIRVETGLLRNHRGQGRAFRFCLQEALRFKLGNPLRRTYLLCTLVHPSSYHLIAKNFHRAYPSHRFRTPPQIETLMYNLADAFGEVPVNTSDPTVRQVGWITRDSPEETALWAASAAEDVRFFLEKNPGYGSGQGLVTLVPLTATNLLLTLLRYMKAHRRLGP